ncbi:MAG: flagellar hook protein [Firmicutes bacterium]|nr:flagellar hook protein [Bacillota bacterium]
MSTNMRIGGLASGMDIDSIMEDLMKAYRMPVQKLEQDKQILEWQQEGYREINTKLLSFRDTAFDMRLHSTYLTNKASSSDDTAVSVSANNSALEGSHTVDITSLAQSASITSGKIGSGDDNTLSSQLGITGAKNIQINDVVFNIDTDSESIYNLVKEINSHEFTGISLNTTDKASDSQEQIQELKLVDDALTEGLTITIGDKKVALYDSSLGNFTSDSEAKTAFDADKVYDISSTDYSTGTKIITAITDNISVSDATLSEDGAGTLTITSDNTGTESAVSASLSGGKEWQVRASYDETVDRFYLSTSKTGADQSITVVDDVLAQELKITDNNEDANTATGTSHTDAQTQDGQNANVSIDGVNYTEYASNQFTLNNVHYSLLKGANSSATVTVSKDTDAVFDSIVKFIDEYNKVIEPITDKLHETKYRDYKPLTDTQREQLTDDQIDQWIEKAQSGLLRNDPILSSVQSKMRMTMSTSVPTGNSDYDRMADIGIATTKDYMSGKLVVDEAKLRQAIENDPEAVMELFAHAPDSEDYNDMGIARRLYEDVNNAMKRISDKAGSKNDYSLVDDSFIGKRIDRIEDQIDRKEERLTQVENRYWRQFTAMEKAIQQMNQQSAWLSQQFGSGGMG